MKVAIATDGNMVAAHFGRCPQYTLIDVEGGCVKEEVVLPNPGHEPGVLPKFLAGQGVRCIIAGGMGSRAQRLFEEYGIQTIVGVSGSVEETIKRYASGTLESGHSTCDHGKPGSLCEE